MRRLLPILLMVLGLAAGAGAGFFLRPAPAPGDAATAEAEAEAEPAQAAVSPTRPEGAEVMRLPNPFLVPLIGEGRVRAMMVLGLALEVAPGHPVDMQRDEPRLRALFLQKLFDHANLGGFDGVFTGGEALLTLRRSLLEAARATFGPLIHDVLIVDLVRQDS
jgi:flagellar protein FliL